MIAYKAVRHEHYHYVASKEICLFTPFAFETLGCMGTETEKFIEKLGSLMKRLQEKYVSPTIYCKKLQSQFIEGMLGNLGTLERSRVDELYSIY